MALHTNSAGVPLIRGARATLTMNKKVYITRNCAVRGVPVPPGSVIDVSFNELQSIRAALRGEEYDPERHKDARPVRIEEGKLVGPPAAGKAKADK